MSFVQQSASRLCQAILPGQARSFVPAAHVPALDGVRGLAILLVLCYDCLKLLPDGSPVTLLIRKVAASGWIGVDLFFVLSGLLITGILLDTVGKRGYWKSFLLRRSVRIFPLYYITLLLVFLLVPWLTQSWNSPRIEDSLNAVGAQQTWYWFYGQNWLYAWQGAWPEERVLNHFWSLAVEEQFYLVWPLVIYCFRGRPLVWICFGLCSIALILRTWLLSSGAAPVVPYVMTITRMDSLCAGALLAIAVRSEIWRANWLRWLPLFGLIYAGLFLAIDSRYPLLESESYGAGSVGHTAIALLFTLLIGTMLALPDNHWLIRIFCFRGLISLGQYSYAIYVFHRIVYYGLLELDWSFLAPAIRGWAIFAATLAGSYLVARLSWVLVEARFLALKKYAPRPTETLPPYPVPEAHKQAKWQPLA